MNIGSFGTVGEHFRGAEGFSLVLDRYELRRGQSVVVTVQVSDPNLITGIFELGLVCTERWAELHTHAASNTSMPDRRETYEAPIYQWWIPLDRTQPRIDMTLPVVAGAPFSHDGTALSFLWTVTARDRRSGFDHLDRRPLTVLP
ncbi:MAG TPA: hypothetical protein VHR88_00015 [Solirubrobacteraceae bacterium]|nr:hypothetical protein [Solirubrobacteraceae bacterium]